MEHSSLTTSRSRAIQGDAPWQRHSSPLARPLLCRARRFSDGFGWEQTTRLFFAEGNKGHCLPSLSLLLLLFHLTWICLVRVHINWWCMCVYLFYFFLCHFFLCVIASLRKHTQKVGVLIVCCHSCLFWFFLFTGWYSPFLLVFCINRLTTVLLCVVFFALSHFYGFVSIMNHVWVYSRSFVMFPACLRRVRVWVCACVLFHFSCLLCLRVVPNAHLQISIRVCSVILCIFPAERDRYCPCLRGWYFESGWPGRRVVCALFFL